MKSYYFFLIVTFLTGFGCSAVQHRDQIGTLLDYSGNQEEQAEFLDEETERFQTLKEELFDGKIVSGTTEKDVMKMVGQPVVSDKTKTGSKWSYKASDSTWFKGEVIRLYFNDEGRLERLVCQRMDCPEINA